MITKRHGFSVCTARCLRAGAALLIASALGACQPPSSTQKLTMASDKKDVVHFDVNLKSYLDRPIFDVHLNGVDIGVASGPPHAGNGAVMTGVAVPLGPQVLTWRDAGTGESLKAANQPVLTRPPSEKRYLGVHIYPDNTFELVPESYWPERTERGEAINREWEKRHGQ
jgi:hypothetical protein